MKWMILYLCAGASLFASENVLVDEVSEDAGWFSSDYYIRTTDGYLWLVIEDVGFDSTAWNVGDRIVYVRSGGYKKDEYYIENRVARVGAKVLKQAQN